MADDSSDGFPVLRKDELDGKQLALWRELTLGPRGFRRRRLPRGSSRLTRT